MAETQVCDRVRALVEPLLAPEGLELVDVVLAGRILRISIDRADGIDLDTISAASRLISDALDEHEDDDPGALAGRYVLEVSSPGIERPLRTPDHFRRFVGRSVVVRTRPGTEGDRRVAGVLEAADDDRIVVAGRTIAHEDIERARTQFEWPEPKQSKRRAGATR